jgi:predicted HicB family RNase H-like nuclease
MTQQPKRGRPHGTVKITERTDVSVALRCRHEERAAWQITARQAGQTLSKWARAALNEKAKA